MLLKKNRQKIHISLLGLMTLFSSSALFCKNLISTRIPLKTNIKIAQAKNPVNRLKSIALIPRTLHAEESSGTLYQLRLHFEQPLNFEKECNNETSTIKLSLYNIDQTDLEQNQFIETCQKISFIKNVTMDRKAHPLNHLVISLECLPESTLVNIQKSKNAQIVTIDFYDKEILTKIKNGTDILRMAFSTETQTVLPRLA